MNERITIDTNVLISAVLNTKGEPALILNDD
jgi:predicted nucleic acid-binding protein